MVLKNSIIIFLALLVGGILNFASISIFSRLLNPADYGLYALSLATSAFLISFIFQWISHSALRFLPQRNELHLSNFVVIIGVISLSFFMIVALCYTTNSYTGYFSQSFPPIIWILVPAAAIIESIYNIVSLHTRLVSNQILFYSIATITRSVLYIVLGYFFIMAGLGYIGLLLAVILSFFIPALSMIIRGNILGTFSKAHINKDIINDILKFGVPIIAFMSLQTAISSTDNFLLTYFIGVEATGQFAVALDLVTKSLIFLMIIINKTAYPLTVQCLEEKGLDAAVAQYRHNGILLLTLSIPACAGLAVLAPNISSILLGEDFRKTSSEIIPFITLISFLNCMFQFYISPAFQLMKKTRSMIFPALIAFIGNILISSLLIPHYGIYGAIGGSFCAYLLCVIAGIFFVRRIFPMPFALKDVAKILIASLVMTLCILPFRNHEGLLTLLSAIIAGGGIYSLLCLGLNVDGYRNLVINFILKKRMTT